MAGDFRVKGQYEGRDISGRYSYTNVIGKQHDELWQIVASHANLLALAVLNISTNNQDDGRLIFLRPHTFELFQSREVNSS